MIPSKVKKTFSTIKGGIERAAGIARVITGQQMYLNPEEAKSKEIKLFSIEHVISDEITRLLDEFQKYGPRDLSEAQERQVHADCLTDIKNAISFISHEIKKNSEKHIEQIVGAKTKLGFGYALKTEIFHENLSAFCLPETVNRLFKSEDSILSVINGLSNPQEFSKALYDGNYLKPEVKLEIDTLKIYRAANSLDEFQQTMNEIKAELGITQKNSIQL